MAADIVEGADRAVRATHRQHRQAGETGDHVVAGSAQPGGMGEQLPAAVEDRAAFQCNGGRIAVPAGRQCDQAAYITRLVRPPVTTTDCDETIVPSALTVTTV